MITTQKTKLIHVVKHPKTDIETNPTPLDIYDPARIAFSAIQGAKNAILRLNPGRTDYLDTKKNTL